MKIKYKVSFWVDKDAQNMIKELKNFGMIFKKDDFKVIEFSDDQQDCELLKAIFKKYDIDLDKRSIFSDEDKINSDYLMTQATWHYGYPQPEDYYLEACYDLLNYCSECGIGKQQINPLRFSKEPKWGRRHFLQLNWILDEYFVPPQVYNSWFKNLNIGFKNVINHKSNIILENTYQLDIPTVECDLLVDSFVLDVCKKCFRKKYRPIFVGKYPALKQKTQLPIFKSKEFFGSGARAYNLIYINNYLYKKMIDKKIEGLNFIPTDN